MALSACGTVFVDGVGGYKNSRQNELDVIVVSRHQCSNGLVGGLLGYTSIWLVDQANL